MKALLLDASRGLGSRRAATAVTVGGLMFAQATCLLVALLALALARPAPFIPDPDRVVLLDFKAQGPAADPFAWPIGSPVSFGPMLVERQAPLELVSRLVGGGIDFDIAGRVQPAFLLIADPDLATLLHLPVLQGDLRATLLRHDGIAITADLVRRLWGDLPPARALGRRVDSHGLFYTVGAVLPDTDPRTPFWDANPMVGGAMAMVGFDSQGNAGSPAQRASIQATNGRVFARLRPGTSVDQVGGWMRDAFDASPLHAQLPPAWRASREAVAFRGVTLAQLPFEGEENELRWHVLGDVGAAGVLLLVLAAFNAMNLQAANLLQRQRETALRRSLGAGGTQLLRLWGAEVSLQLVAAGAGALLLAWWVAPSVSAWMGLSPGQPVADPIPPAVFAGLAVVVALLLPLILAVPAWAALRRPPAPALQGRTASEGPGGRRLRQGLLAVQLAGALLLLSLAGVLVQQQRHLLHADRGFETRNRLWLGVMDNPEALPDLGAFVAALGSDPAITHWAWSDVRPTADTEGRVEMHLDPATRRQAALRVTVVSPGFFETWGMTVLAGAPKVGAAETDVVVDARAARLLGFDPPQAAVGTLLRAGGGALEAGNSPRRVVAVVKDVTMESARAAAMPQSFVLSDRPQWDFTVTGPDMAALRQALEAAWAAHGPPVPHDIRSADELLGDVYRQEDRLATLLAGVALLAVGVAMVGAYALVSDTLRRRRTELVLRRLHGAGAGDVVAQVALEFAAPLAIAAIAALPLAAWLGERYLDGFVDRVHTAAGLVFPLASASAATLCITALAALRHVRLALALQPIEALR